ncbi:two-component system chemotaxis sensor kinase CheA [Pseudoduganella flava]|uniref:Chemotaxis protein CheA n=1 Tax=Pseudoduganella flava TaxID=871742 RepID=A0A562PTV1_9BURK|nr:chemotaxis protein CheA [Pseudoduganella flava]QGZ39191.1 chemotaxis protein CheA [Pseudoduganella flava]TWI47516.1 two-component system chemotaxis sensor kinase CheA [Pseudoduganella flava]
MNIDQVMITFIAESRELLEQMENALLAVAHDGPEAVNAIFRAAHTIKGSAGMFGLDAVVEFTHVAESVLDKVRDGAVPVSDELVTLLLSCADHIGALVDAVEAGTLEGDTVLPAAGAPLVAALQGYLEGGVSVAAKAAVPMPAHAVSEAEQWHISLRFGADVLRNGMDPLSFIRYLGQMGRITGIATLTDGLPGADEFDPESCYLGFEIGFHSSADKAAIDSVFDFVRDDCQIRILAPHSKITEYIAWLDELPEQRERLGEMLVRCGSITAHELEQALAAQSAAGAAGGEVVPIGTILVDQGAVRAPVVEAALVKQRQAPEAKPQQENRSVRVDADKLDRLINLVGELIIAGAGANLVARRTQIPELLECTSTLSDLVEEVRDSALQLRMVKIGATFNRFGRVVHDVSRELGKDIRLQVSGEDAELDKTVVEKIGDPLTHLVRNAMDHGIEPVDVRAARGKPAQGTVALNAYHDSGSIVIEVSDDGGGLKRERILAKAVERGLVEPGRTLTDKEIFGLIFEPGFSTAEQVTNLSGRGVGMDVVKRNIVALRGSVEIASTEGVGTTVTVRLPLTLAIINGFQVGVGKSVFVIPMDMVEECIEFREADHAHADYVDLRGQPLPFVRLRERFALHGAAARRQSIVVVRYGSRKAGLVVDTLLGEFQTVIKPLGKVFSGARFLSGSSILGNGDVALILDMAALLNGVEADGQAAA